MPASPDSDAAHQGADPLVLAVYRQGKPPEQTRREADYIEDLLGLAPHPKLALHSLPDAVKIEGLPNAFTIMFVIVSDDPVLSVSTTDEHENGTDCTQLCNWSSLAGASP